MSTTTVPIESEARRFLTRGVGGDPYPLYRRLRDEAPVLAIGETYLVSRHADVRAVLRDARMFQSGPNPHAKQGHSSRRLPAGDALPEATRAAYLEEFVDFQRPTLTRTDGDVHDRIRSAFKHLFTPRAVARQRAIVESTVAELLDAWEGESVVDALETFALRLPLYVITDLIGAPREDAPLIRQWSTDIFPGGKHLEVTHAAIEGFCDYLPGLIERRPVAASDGRGILLETLLASRDEGLLDTRELASNMVNLLFAGHETTTNLLGSGLYWSLRHREEWERMLEDPTLVRTAVEEFIRYEAPVQYLGRSASADTEIAGTPIPAGTTILPLLGAANRDPERFEDPDRFDVGRSPNDHLAFGYGMHFCIGAFLARLEGEVALSALLERYPELTLVEDQPVWRENFLFRGLEQLPVRPRP